MGGQCVIRTPRPQAPANPTPRPQAQDNLTPRPQAQDNLTPRRPDQQVGERVVFPACPGVP